MAPAKSFGTNKPFRAPKPALAKSSNHPAASDSDSSSAHDEGGEVSATQEAASSQSHPAIPAALLSRILHDSFSKSDTRMTKDALAVIEKYVEVFTREAVVRTVLVQQEQKEHGTGGGEGFLEVDDLEKIVPQLLLDF